MRFEKWFDFLKDRYIVSENRDRFFCVFYGFVAYICFIAVAVTANWCKIAYKERRKRRIELATTQKYAMRGSGSVLNVLLAPALHRVAAVLRVINCTVKR